MKLSKKINLIRIFRIIIFMLVFCSLFVPYFYELSIKSIDIFLTTVRYLFLGSIFISYLSVKKKAKIIWIIAAYCIYNIWITYMYWGWDIGWTIEMLSIIAISMFFDYLIKKRKLVIFEDFIIAWNILVVINFISEILFQGGIGINEFGNNYFFGFDNGMIIILFPVLCLNIIIVYIKYNIIKMNIPSWICVFSLLLSGSATSIIATWLLLLLYSLYYVNYRNRKNIKNNIYNFIISAIGIFVLLVVYRKQKYLSWIVVTLFKRDLTFTGRTDLWDAGIDRFMSNPIWGYGQNATYQRTIYYGVSSTHNHILDILNQSGFIGLSMFIIIIMLASAALYKNRNNILSILLSLFIGIFLVIMQFESYSAYSSYPIIFSLIICSYNIKHLENIKKK